MPSLVNPLTFQLYDNGVILNDDTVISRPFVDINAVHGLDNAPYRETRRDHEGVDGGFIDAEFETGREIQLEGTVYSNGTSLEAFLDNLKSNFAPVREVVPFYFTTESNEIRFLNVKPTGCNYDWELARRLGITDVKFNMFAEDPRIYSNTLTSQTMDISTINTNGFSFNIAFNLSFGGSSAIGSGQFFLNAGNRPTPAVMTILGPVTNPTIINDTIGISLVFLIDIAASETLVIDLANHTVRLNGITNRRNTMLSPTWFMFDPGYTFIRFAAASGSGTLTVNMRSAWR